MKIYDFVMFWYKDVKPLEAQCIARAIKKRQWKDFDHNPLERILFYIVSHVLKPFGLGERLTKWIWKLPSCTVCLFKGHVWYPKKCYPNLHTYYCLRCVKIISECPHKEKE